MFKKDRTNDKQLVEDVAKELTEAGAWVTWYGGGYDVPYVNSRLIVHGLGVMPPVPHIDLWRVCREKLKLHSNRLASASSFLGLEEKTKLNGPIWIKAGAGDKGALKYVEEHAAQDVIVLAQAYDKMRPLITTGPNLALLQGITSPLACSVCASQKVQRRGTRVAKTNTYVRTQCQDCGHWDSLLPSKLRGKAGKAPKVSKK